MKLHPKNQCQKQNHPFAYLTGPIQSSPSSTLHTIMQFQMGPSFLARCSSCLDSTATHHAHQSQWNHRHFGRSKIADNRNWWRVSNLNKFATHCNPIQIRAFLRCHTQFAEGGRIHCQSRLSRKIPPTTTDDKDARPQLCLQPHLFNNWIQNCVSVSGRIPPTQRDFRPHQWMAMKSVVDRVWN